VIQQLLKEKGHLSIASLTVNEFIQILDSYKEDKEFGEKLTVIEKKEDHLVDIETIREHLKVSRTTFYRMRLKGLPEYIVQGKSRFNINEVKRAIKNDKF